MRTLREVLLIGKNGRFILLGLTLFILATVLGMGWFQYQQVSRVSNSESSGYNNFVWEFFELEHHLLKYQLALRESQSDLADLAKLEDASNAYNIFASQVLLINRSTAADPLLDKRVFIETMEMAAAYVRQTDLLLESVPKNITKLQIEEALDGSEQLGEQIHRLVGGLAVVVGRKAGVFARINLVPRVTCHRPVFRRFVFQHVQVLGLTREQGNHGRFRKHTALVAFPH